MTDPKVVQKRRLLRRKWKASLDISREDQMRLLMSKFASKVSAGGKITRVPLS